MSISSLLPSFVWEGLSMVADSVQNHPIVTALFAAGLSTEVALSWTRNVSILESTQIDLRRIVELCPWVEKTSLEQRLLEAIESGNESLAICYIKQGANDPYALHLASIHGRLGVVRVLLEKGANIHHRANMDGATSLHHAAMKGKTATARLLLEWGADINARDLRYATPLHNAVQNSELSAAKVLLDHGADLYIRDIDEATPFHCIAYTNNIPMIRLMREHGVNWMDRCGLSRTILHRAARFTSIDVIQHLLDEGFPADPVTVHRRTPLYFAVQRSSIPACQALIRGGANLNHRDADGLTPLNYAHSCEFSLKVINWAIVRPFLASLKRNRVALPHVIRRKIAVKVYVDLIKEDGLRAHLEGKKLHAFYDHWAKQVNRKLRG